MSLSYDLCKYKTVYEKVKFVKTSMVSYKMSQRCSVSRFLKIHLFNAVVKRLENCVIAKR